MGVYLFNCGGEVTANRKQIHYESTYYYGGNDSKSFPCLPVPLAKYGAPFCVLSRFLLHNSAFKHYSSVLFGTLSCTGSL